MLYIRNISLLSLGLLISCVTINVYFPAAEAEKAADQVIKNVWERQTDSPTPSFDKFDPNFKTSSPRSNALQAKMTQRHHKLKIYYNNGAIGLTNNAFIIVRSPIKIPLKKRNHVRGKPGKFLAAVYIFITLILSPSRSACFIMFKVPLLDGFKKAIR